MLNLLKKYPALTHVLFWIGVYMLDVASGDMFKKFYWNSVYGMVGLIPQIIASYFTVYYLVPKFLKKKKYVLFGIYFLISAYLISVFARILMVHVAEALVREPPFDQESFKEIFTNIEWLALGYFPPIYIMVLFFWLVTILNFKGKDLSLQKEKTTAELNMLKSQLNPHFLFNTLNNIYSLSLDNSPKTSESIGRLSKILDYVLYRCNSKFVPLSGEITMLEDYIALEKLRYDERLQVNFVTQIENDIEIAPLILLSLVENAFKHGAGEDGGYPKIDINIQTIGDSFKFVIVNTVADSETDSEKKSIGLENIKKQLDLIYLNKYELLIDKVPNLFKVTLKLNS